ncbi:MAG: GPP34 family phosphoprotein [Ornithinimicrobium sp.]
MLIAEEFLLISTKPNGKLVSSAGVDIGVAGAFLSELAQRDRVGVGADGTLEIVDSSSVDDPLLDPALRAFAAEAGRKVNVVLPIVGKDLLETTYARLQEEGLVAREEHRTMGVFRTTSWPPSSQEQDRCLDQLAKVLSGERATDPRTGTLIALLQACGITAQTVGQASSLSDREITARAKEVLVGDWASAAVKDAIAHAEGVIIATLVAAGVFSGGSLSS